MAENASDGTDKHVKVLTAPVIHSRKHRNLAGAQQAGSESNSKSVPGADRSIFRGLISVDGRSSAAAGSE